MHSLSRIFAACALLLTAAPASRPQEDNVTVHPPSDIEFTATVQTKSFDSGWFMPGYHATVWKGGRAAHAALFAADVSDTEILKALESLGAKPGNNLSMKAWEERHDSKSTAPDSVIAGPPVEVLLRLPGRSELVPLASVLEDSGGRGIEMRFGGNEVNIPKWKSGCIVCLYSCPGSKVGNARYTVRDYAKKTTSFHVRPGVLPADGTRVGVVLRVKPE